MECKLCMEHLNQDLHLPIILSCGHTICKSCLRKITETGKNNCPFDRTVLGPEEKFRINFFILELLDHPYQSPAITPPLPPNSIPTCDRSHPLIQIATFDQLDLPESKSFCSYCKLPSLSSLLYCKDCSFLLCEDCSKDESSCQHQPSRKIFCKNNHELKYYSNSSYFYTRKRQSTRRVRCNLCNTSQHGGSWACRLCHFDLCLNCINRLQKGSNLLCPSNHQLDPLILNNENYFSCSVCEATRQNYCYECCLCRFKLCEKCIDYYYRNTQDDRVSCAKGHGLVYSDDPYLCYSDLFKNLDFYCSCCKEETAQRKVFHCLACRVLICYLCFRTICDGIEFGIENKCALNHELKFCFNVTEIRKQDLICDLCRNRYSRSGSFSCLECKFDICIVCARLGRSC